MSFFQQFFNENREDIPPNPSSFVEPVSSSSAPMSSNLPNAASHSYLGDTSQELYNRNILQANQIYQILIYPLPDIVLFPGETVPLRIQNREFILKLQEILRAMTSNTSSEQQFACHIGILRVNQMIRSHLERVGTTVEVRATHGRTTFDDEELIITGKGRHRFELLNIKRLPPPSNSQRPSNILVGEVRIFQDELMLPKLFPRAALNPFPISLYQRISPTRLAKRAYELFEKVLLWKGKENKNASILQKWGYDEERGKYTAELDPVAFSFSLCANLPIPSSDLQELLNSVDVIDRLNLAIHYLLRSQQLQSKIACQVCNQTIANKQDLFNVPGAEGCAGAYVNSYGAVHQTMTFRKLNSSAMVELSGGPSTQDSWFPGYAWTIVHCQRCYNHLGWRFTIVDNHVEEASNVGSTRRRGRNSLDNSETDNGPSRRQRIATTNNSSFNASSLLGRLLRRYIDQVETAENSEERIMNHEDLAVTMVEVVDEDSEVNQNNLNASQSAEESTDQLEIQELDERERVLRELDDLMATDRGEGEDDAEEDEDFVTAEMSSSASWETVSSSEESKQEGLQLENRLEANVEQFHDQTSVRSLVTEFWGLRRSALRESATRSLREEISRQGDADEDLD